MTTFDQRRDLIRSIAEQEYRSITWVNPNSLAELPSIPDWMPSAVVRRVFGELMVNVADGNGSTYAKPDQDVISTVIATAAEISGYLQVGVARAQAGQSEIPNVEQECVSATLMLHQSTPPPNFEAMTEPQRIDTELQMAFQVVTYWVSQVLVVRLKELRLEERTRG